MPELIKEYNDKLKRAEDILSSHRGIMPVAHYNKIMACLHPDRLPSLCPGQALNQEALSRYGEAFQLFTEHKAMLVKVPFTPDPRFPRTREEWEAAREATTAARKAATAKRKAERRAAG